MPSWSAILLHPVWPSFPVRKRPLWAKRLEGSRTLLLPPLLHVDHPPPLFGQSSTGPSSCQAWVRP